MWSKKYGKECYDCGTKKRKHISQGLCTTCYSRFYYNSNPQRREQAKAATYNWMKNNPEQWKKIQKKAMKKFVKKHKLSTTEEASVS